MAEVLVRFLSADEITELSQDVRGKLEKEFQTKENSMDLLKGEVDRIKAEYEQKCYEIEKNMIEMSTRLNSASSNCSQATGRSNELEEEVKSLKTLNGNLEMSFAEAQGEIAALKHTHDLWKEEKMSMQHIIEKRDLEITEIKAEWKAISDKLAATTLSKNELELKLDELQNSGVTIQYSSKRLEKEKELLTQQNDQLSEELKWKSTELNSIKLQKENELVSLRGRLEVKMDECKQLSTVSENLRITNDELEKKIDDLLEKANTAEADHRSMEEAYRNELQSQTSLAELYKAAAKDEEEKSNELASAVRELQQIVTKSSNEVSETMTKLGESEKKSNDLLYQIELLKGELEKANDLLAVKKGQDIEKLSDEELAALCPTAAMASKFIKSGMTLTEIYSKYIETLDELEIAKQESKRSNDTMDAILEELNEKAPILKQQKEDYERALSTITQLTSQTDAAVIECQQLRAETDDSTRKLARMEREKQRLQIEVADLSTQVRFLLKEVEESRGNIISMDQSLDDTELENAANVISEHLLTFRSIKGLQQQNQRLLKVVRELSEESEARERETQNKELKELKDSLEQANEELDHLREERAKQIEFVEAIVRQRDMYRVLLAQEPKTGIPLSILSSPSQMTPTKDAPNTPKTPTPQKDATDDSSTKALQVLKQEFDEYRKEVKDNNKELNDQTDRLRSQISELRTDNTKLQASLNFSSEKYDVLRKTYENVRKESEMYREKNSKLSILIQKQELNINKITNDLSCVQQEKGKFQSKVENLLSEIDILRRTEDRLKADNTALQRDQRGQTVLLANIQKIQQSMEKQEFEVRSELRGRLESQERELKTLRRTTNETVQQKQTVIQMTEKQLLQTQQNLEKQQQASETLSATLRKVKSELEASKLDDESNKTKVANLEQKLAKLAGEKGGKFSVGDADDEVAENLKDMKTKCSSLEDEVSSLKLKLEKAQRVVQQHKEFAAATEESLKQANSANNELSETLELRLKNASEHQTKLEQQITKLEDENRQLNSKKTSLISEVDLRTADLNRQMATLQSDLDLALKREKDLRKSEQEARNAFTEQKDMIQDAEDKYKREMLLHADCVKELMQLKEKSQVNASELEKAKNEAEQAKHLLDSNKGMWEKHEVKLSNEVEEMKERNKDLSDQLSALHTQLETMSKQMVALQQKSVATSPAAKYSRISSLQQTRTAAAAAEDPSDKSNEQLMDIIKFLRKEKNLCEVKCEVAQSENNRMKQQLLHLQKQSDEFKKSLQTERQKSQATSAQLSEHEALMKKVETLNVLTDSNRMLREEKDRIQDELKITKTSLVELKQKFSPLQAENNQYSTQIATLKSEKVILEQDVQRWQQRSQQLIQSPRRQDPEEYRKLISEQQKLQRSVEQLNKEVTDKKLEVSNLQGKIRDLNQQTETLKNQNTALTKKVETSEADIKTKQAEVEEKNKTIMQIRRVGRRYKTQFEELQKKQQDMEASQKSAEESRAQDTSVSEATLAENNAKLSAMEASLSRTTKEKEDTQKQLDMKSAEVEALKSQLQHANQKISEESKASSSEVVEENQKLITERDEMKKQLQEKDDKSKRLLTLAKNRIEQIRKDKDEIASERDRLQSEETKMKGEVEKLRQDVKTETELKAELQTKVEDLQKQLAAATTQQQQQNKVTSVVGHQVYHLPGTSGMVEPRKAANIRPISTQRVSQVSPMRVTRTARVMPEPQQEAQEGSSTDSVPTRSSPHAQVAPSSSHLPAANISLSTSSSSMPTRAFVHPINPSTGRHQHVVSSMPTSSGSHQMPSRSDATPVEQAVVRGNTSSSTDGQSQEASVSSVVAMSSTNADVSESDQAIVSSSDDQPAQSEDSIQPSVPSTSQGQTSSTTTVAESDSAPSQSSNASSSNVPSSAVSSIPVLIGRQVHLPSHKRTYEDADESTSAMDDSPGSSSDAQVSMAPVSKRQRSSPDQSSSAVHPVTSQSSLRIIGESSTTRIQQAESSVVQVEVKSSSEVEAQVSSHQDEDANRDEEDRVDTSTFTPIAQAEEAQSTEAQPMPSSSGAEVIVLSSDESGEDELNVDQDHGEIYVDVDGGMIADPEEDEDSQEADETVPTISAARPILVLHPTPPDILRNRTPMRPAPLTPGLTAPSADDGDGIVPCTPTLPTRRHDDNYQTINSPHVPPGGPPIRFRFEDVSAASQSMQPQTGIGTVDNTIMDFSGAGDEARGVPTTPVATITTVTHTFMESSQVPQSEVAAVSSSIMVDQEELINEGKDDFEGESIVPISSSVSDEATGPDNSSMSENPVPTNLQNIRGRRIRLIGARSRGKGGTSPSTSNQQP